MIKQSKKKSRTPLRGISTKRAASKAEYTKAYQKQDARILATLGYIPCSSCDITVANYRGTIRPWGHSHNMSVKHFPLLEADPKNFSPRCQNDGERKGCHEKLDEPDFSEIILFKDFHELMQYRQEHDKNAYNQWVTKLKEIGYEEYDYID